VGTRPGYATLESSISAANHLTSSTAAQSEVRDEKAERGAVREVQPDQNLLV
jgi:hypothetical protein